MFSRAAVLSRGRASPGKDQSLNGKRSANKCKKQKQKQKKLKGVGDYWETSKFSAFCRNSALLPFFFISSGKNIYWHPNSNLEQHKMPIAGFCRCQNRLISPQTSVRSRRFWKKHVNRYFSFLTKKNLRFLLQTRCVRAFGREKHQKPHPKSRSARDAK